MTRRIVPALVATMLLAACGSSDGAAADAGTDTADVAAESGPDVAAEAVADVAEAADPGTDAEVPAADVGVDIHPIVPPLCDPATLGSVKGEAVPIDDFVKPPSETQPFPNLALSVGDATAATGVRLHFADHPMTALLNHLDGFGVTAPFVVPLAGAPDPASLPADVAASTTAGASVFLLRTDDVTGIDGQRFADTAVPVRVTWDADAGALVVEPTVTLAERAHYALVVTRCVRDGKGLPLARAPAMGKLLTETDGSPMHAEMDRALAFLARPDVNLPNEAIALVLPTVTRTARSHLAAAVAAAKSVVHAPKIDWSMAPTLADGTLDPAFLAKYPGLDALIADQFPESQRPVYDFRSIALVAHGTMTMRRYADPVNYLNPDASGTPQSFEDVKIGFFLTLPRPDAQYGHVQPFPLVVFQHAFGVCKETALAIAGTYSRMGIATIGIDAVAHGERAVGGAWKCPIDVTTFLTLDDPVRLWYNFAESVLDLAQLVQAAKEFDFDVFPPGGDGKADVRTDVVGLTAQSMGSFIAADVAGLVEGLGPVVLNVGGGQEALFFAWGMVASSGADPLAHSFSTLSGLILDIMGPVQAAMDDVEPLALMTPGVAAQGRLNVLMQQANEDKTVPLACGRRLALHLGLARMTPGFTALPDVPDEHAPVKGNLYDATPGAPAHTGAIAQFSPAKHEFLLVNDWYDKDPLTVLRGQIQAGLFARTFFDDDVPTVIDPYDAIELANYLPLGITAK